MKTTKDMLFEAIIKRAYDMTKCSVNRCDTCKWTAYEIIDLSKESKKPIQERRSIELIAKLDE